MHCNHSWWHVCGHAQIILQDLIDGFIDEPPICAHVKPIQDIARRWRDCIREVEKELGRQSHNMSNVEMVNESLAERVSGLVSYNCFVVNYLEAACATADTNAAAVLKYKIGFCVVTCTLIICVMHMIF